MLLWGNFFEKRNSFIKRALRPSSIGSSP